MTRHEVDLEESHQAREAAEFLLEISRTLISLISAGDSSEASEGAKRFHEDHFMRRKWGNLPVFSPVSILPAFQFQVALAEPNYAEPSVSEVYEFLKKTFDLLHLPRELAVISLIYIGNRVAVDYLEACRVLLSPRVLQDLGRRFSTELRLQRDIQAVHSQVDQPDGGRTR